MKKMLLVFCVCIVSQLVAQKDTLGSWIDMYQESIVSLGVISTYNDPIDKKVKSYFNIVGTGMMFYVNLDSITIPCLITAKHVFAEPTKNWSPEKLYVRFFDFRDKPLNQYLGEELLLKEKGKPTWFEHDDPNVDLVCIPIVEKPGNDIVVFPYQFFAQKEDYYEGAQLLVLGYPGIVTPDFQTKALARSGIISWVDPIKPNGNIVLIDSQLFGGNSGGPVIKMPTGIGRNGSFTMDHAKFLGIVSQGRYQSSSIRDSNQKVIENEKGTPLFFSTESVGIGVIEPAIRVYELLNTTQKTLKAQGKLRH